MRAKGRSPHGESVLLVDKPAFIFLSCDPSFRLNVVSALARFPFLLASRVACSPRDVNYTHCCRWYQKEVRNETGGKETHIFAVLKLATPSLGLTGQFLPAPRLALLPDEWIFLASRAGGGVKKEEKGKVRREYFFSPDPEFRPGSGSSVLR